MTSFTTAVQTYQSRMTQRIGEYSSNPSVKKVLQFKVQKIARENMRDPQAPASEKIIADDFKLALEEVRVLESHAFNIKAPPALTRDSLNFGNRPLSSNQSIVRHSVRTADELMTIAKAFGVTNAIRGIIPLTTERLVQHNLIRKFVLNFCLQGELSTELKKVIKPLSQRLLTQADSKFKELHKMRDNFESQVLEYLRTNNREMIVPKLVEIADTLLKQARAQNSGLRPDRILEAVAMRAADLSVEVFVQKIVDDFDMASAEELRGYKPLPAQTHETRRIFMINGGVASGKSSAKRIQDAQAIQEGVYPETVCTINRDAFKPMLLQPEEVDPSYQEFFASFTEDEAFLLRDAILREYQSRLTMNTAPHLYIDQVSPTVEMLNMAGAPSGRGLDLTIVYSPVENSFCMAEGREKETGYGAVTAGLLNSHANVSKQLIENVQAATKSGKNNIRLKIMANVAPGVLRTMATIDYSKGTGSIEDRDLLLSFFHKKHINPNATKFGEIYDVALPPANECPACVPMADELMAGIRQKKDELKEGSQ